MKFPVKVLLAAGIPLVVMTGIGIALLTQGNAADGRSTLAVGVIASAVSGGAFIYQVPGWSLTKQSVIHFLLMLVTVLPALLLSGWFPLRGIGDVCIVIGVFLAAGAVLWGAMYLIFTKIVNPRAARAKG